MSAAVIAACTPVCALARIGNHPCAFDWYHDLWPWMKLKRPRSRQMSSTSNIMKMVRHDCRRMFWSRSEHITAFLRHLQWLQLSGPIKFSRCSDVLLSERHSVIASHREPTTATVGLPASLIQRLQSVQNATDPLIYSTRWSEHITDALISLHWVRVQQRIGSSLK